MGTGIAGAQDYVPTPKEGEWKGATCDKVFDVASARAWASSSGLQQQCKRCYNKHNTYTQREWDRIVGWGTVPKEYSRE